MNIAFLTPEFITEPDSWHGGLANYLARIAPALVTAGHRVEVFVLADISDTISYRGVIIHRLKFPGRLYRFLNRLTFYRLPTALQSLIFAVIIRLRVPAGRFDIIQAASFLTPSLLLNPRSPPVIIRLSSLTAALNRVRRRGGLLDNRLVGVMEKIAARNAASVYAPSQLIRKLAEQEFHRPVDLLLPPLYPIPEKNDSRYFLNITGKHRITKYFLSYGTLSYLKGTWFIAGILEKFLSRHSDYHFIFIGPAEEGIVAGLMSAADPYRSRVIYISALKHPQLMPFIAGAKALVLPSIMDNLPNTLIESMSLGKIVVGTPEAGFQQLIRSNLNGFLVRFGSDRQLISVLDRIADLSPAEQKKLEANARRTILLRLHPQKQVAALEKYYYSVTKKYHD